LRVVALVAPGLWQRHLLWRLSREHELVGYVLQESPPGPREARVLETLKRYRDPHRLLDHLDARRALRESERRASAVRRELFFVDGAEPDAPAVPSVRVPSVNDGPATELVQRLAPDVVVVNGTNLLRGPALAAGAPSRFGILNIHTGLSPYSRGGSCNLHAVLHGQLQLVGVTVHHIDAGIDSGDIVLSGRPDVTPEDTIETLDDRSFRLGEDLLMVALEDLREGCSRRVRQWTAGRLFLKRTGYVYRPRLRVMANRLLHEGGLIQQYLAHRANYDERVSIVVSARSQALHPAAGQPRLLCS
jgi:hypothetical protein